jgi:hypothetical protein
VGNSVDDGWHLSQERLGRSPVAIVGHPRRSSKASPSSYPPSLLIHQNSHRHLIAVTMYRFLSASASFWRLLPCTRAQIAPP